LRASTSPSINTYRNVNLVTRLRCQDPNNVKQPQYINLVKYMYGVRQQFSIIKALSKILLKMTVNIVQQIGASYGSVLMFVVVILVLTIIL